MTTSTTTHADRRFAVMGTAAHVIVEHPTRAIVLAEVAEYRLRELERRWSRFRTDSEISRMNALSGMPIVVSSETALLVANACEAWRRTAGRYDPTVLDAVEAIGYDRDLAELLAGGPVPGTPTTAIPAPGCAGIDVDRTTGLVLVPEGTRIDPGGIGKGLAADLVAEELLAEGATGALVNVGGDLRVVGRPAGGGPWRITVDDPTDPIDPTDAPGGTRRFCADAADAAADLVLEGGGIATSSTRRRRWWQDGQPVHHVVDPRTGRSADTTVASVTVVAGAAWWAEALATALLIADPADRPGLLHGETAVVIDGDGTVTTCEPQDSLR